MIRVEKLQRWHLERLRERGVAVDEILDRPDYVDALTINGYAAVALDGVCACIGLSEQNHGNYRVWALTDPILASKYFLAINRACRRFLVEFNAPRVETVVYMGNLKGDRWVRIHGFEPEGVMRNWNDGRDAMLYSRI